MQTPAASLRVHLSGAVLLLLGTPFAASASAQCDPDELVPDQPAGGFGIAVSIDGTEALVGANLDSGAGSDFGSAILFEQQPTGWAQTARLTPTPTPTFGQFGFSVALDEDTVLAGAPYSPSGSGSAYVFERIALTWTQTANLSGGDFFGWSVALDGDRAVVGELFDGTAGAVSIYARLGSNWVFDQKINADVPVLHDEFGWSVSTSGPWVLVGAPRQPLTSSGSAYVFAHRATSWVQIDELTPSDGGSGDEFGHSVAVEGDRALIGSNTLGGAYVFEFDGLAWNETQKLTATGGITGQVALSGDTALVGAHVFELSGGTWELVGLLSTDDGPLYGAAAAVDGDLAVLGDTPSAFVFELSECECGTTSYCSTSPNSQGPGALISAAGSTNVAANDLVLVVDGAIPGEFGVFYYGPEEVQMPFGDGFRCVGGGSAGLFRLNPPIQPDSTGSTSRPLDLTAPPADAGPGMIGPGSRWNFQFWYRDPSGPGGGGFNLSDALHVQFCP